jgi:predicted transcriptional regulator
MKDDSDTSSWNSSSILIISDKILTVPKRPVKEIMSRKVYSVYEFNTFLDAAQLLRDKKIDQAPVIDEDEHLLGLLTNWDILSAYASFLAKE